MRRTGVANLSTSAANATARPGNHNYLVLNLHNALPLCLAEASVRLYRAESNFNIEKCAIQGEKMSCLGLSRQIFLVIGV